MPDRAADAMNTAFTSLEKIKEETERIEAQIATEKPKKADDLRPYLVHQLAVLAKLSVSLVKMSTDSGVLGHVMWTEESTGEFPDWLMSMASGLLPDGQPLYVHQVLMMQMRARYVVIHGGVGTSKTTACILRLLIHCHQYPGQRIAVTALTYKQLRNVFLSEWQQLVPDEAYTWNQSDQEITLPRCNSRLRLHYADRKGANQIIRGENLSGYLCLQPETWRDPSFHDELKQRVRIFGQDPDAPEYVRLYDANAGHPTHFLHSTLLDTQSESYIGAKDPEATTPLPDVVRVLDGPVASLHVTSTARTSTYSQETLDEWEQSLPPDIYKRMVQGLASAMEGRVFTDYTVLDQPIKPSDVQRFWIGMDPGTAEDPGKPGVGNLGLVVLADCGTYFCAAAGLAIAFKGLTPFKAAIRKLVDHWSSEGGDYVGLVKDWAGGAGVPMASALRADGLGPVWKPAADGKPAGRWKPVSAGIALLYDAFQSSRLVISPDAKVLITDLELYQYTAGEPDKKSHDPHCLDALRYVWIRVSRHG